MSGRDLSVQCFHDVCADCEWPGCECRCHDAEEWDVLDGWVPREDEETA